MFPTFTGNSKRQRQVNLSGRANNPFAAAQSSGSNKTASRGSDAIAHAQAERRARQHERERLQASKRLQRVWRGYSARKDLRADNRKALEESESQLNHKQIRQITSADICDHVRLCIYTAWPQMGRVWDVERTLFTGRLLVEKVRAEGLQTVQISPALLRGLQKLLMRFLNSALFSPEMETTQRLYLRDCASHSQPAEKLASQLLGAFEKSENGSPGLRFHAEQGFNCLGWMMRALRERGPHQLSDSASKGRRDPTPDPAFHQNIPDLVQYFRIIARLIQLGIIKPGEHPADPTLQLGGQSVNTLITVFLEMPGSFACRSKPIYESFIVGILLTPELPREALFEMAHFIDINFCLQVLGQLLDFDITMSLDGNSELSISGSDQVVSATSDHDYVKTRSSVVASIEDLLQNTVFLCEKLHGSDHSMSQDASTDTGTCSINISFFGAVTKMLNKLDVMKMRATTIGVLRSLTKAERIADLFMGTSVLAENGNDADILADFILTAVRLLPDQADEVRMWLYLSHRDRAQDVGQEEKHRKSALRYFWDAAAANPVFKEAARGYSKIEDDWTDSGFQTYHIGRRQEDRSSYWKTILLFMELYTFALRLQDDEQFVQGLSADWTSSEQQSNTLTLEEISSLVAFLKTTAHSIISTGQVVGGSSIQDRQHIGVVGNAEQAHLVSVDPKLGVSMFQLKGTVTGLLRMIYERNSRRKFLSPDDFLMRNVLSAQSIDDVLRETELRERLGLEGDEEEEETLDYAEPPLRPQEVMESAHMRTLRAHEIRAQTYAANSRRQTQQRAAPNMEILENIPFIVPFATRVELFRRFVRQDMMVRRQGHVDPDEWRHAMMAHRFENPRDVGAHQAELRREHILQDAFDAFYKLGDGLKEPIRIAFVDEEGIDGGGVTKEFLTSMISEVFRTDAESHLFAENDRHELFPTPYALDVIDVRCEKLRQHGVTVTEQELREQRRRVLQLYEFLGRIVGKCLYEGILVDIPLARFFVAKWALTGGEGAAPNETMYRPTINDLYDLDQALYHGMLQLKNYVGDVGEIGLTFSITDDVGDGEQRERELRPGGADRSVTTAERLIYIQLMVKHAIVDRQYPQTRAFLRGLGSIIKPTWLRMFNEAEIRVLLGGLAKPIDVEDLRKHTAYSGVYQIGDDGREHQTIRWFWEVMHEMQDSDRRALLQYVTSTPNAPLEGFRVLNPMFSIRDALSDQGRLPTASTCMNLLKLPIYRTKEGLRDRVLTAIHSGAKFDLS